MKLDPAKPQVLRQRKRKTIFGALVELGLSITIECNPLNLLNRFGLISRDNYTTEESFLLKKSSGNLKIIINSVQISSRTIYIIHKFILMFSNLLSQTRGSSLKDIS